MPVLFSRVSPLLRWNHLQQPLALGELGFLLMRSLTPQLHLTKPLFACASPGLCHRPWINIHTDFGVPYEQLVFQPLYPQHSAAPNPNYYLSVQQDHCSLRLPLTSSRLGKIPKYKSQDRQGFLSMLLCSVCHLTPANSCFICSVCLIAVCSGRLTLLWSEVQMIALCFSCENQPGPGMLMTKFLHSLHLTPRRLWES